MVCMKLMTLALAILLAACVDTDGSRDYPTEVFEHVQADGSTLLMYGSYAMPVCHAIAVAACDSNACELEFMDNCTDPWRNGAIQTPVLAAWDKLWGDCFDGVDALANADTDYNGRTMIAECENLTPYWSVR